MGKLRGHWTVPDREALRSDPAWRYPILFGALSVPVTLALGWLSPNVFYPSPVFVAGLLAGFLVDGERPLPTRVGFRAGLVGSIGLVPELARLLPSFDLGLVPWLLVPLVVPLLAAVLVAVMGMVGAIGGEVGNWLSELLGPNRSTANAD